MTVRTRQSNKGSVYVVDVNFQHPDGRKQRVRKDSEINTRKGAQKEEREILNSLGAGTYKAPTIEAPAKSFPTFSQYAARFLRVAAIENKHSTQILKQQLIGHYLEPFFGEMTLDAIQVDTIEDFKGFMLARKHGRGGTTLSPKTINNALGCLSTVLTKAVEHKLLNHSPRVKMLPAARPSFDFLSFEEAPRLMAAADTEWRTMITVALTSGLRLGELIALRWSDVDLPNGQLTVNQATYRGVTDLPKGGRTRVVDLPAPTVALLKAHQAETRLKGLYVFPQVDGNQLREAQCRCPLERALKAAGITRDVGIIGWHDLRHTYASHLAMLGVPIGTIQQLLGHSSLEMTQRYAHLSPGAKRQAVQCLTYESVPMGEVAELRQKWKHPGNASQGAS